MDSFLGLFSPVTSLELNVSNLINTSSKLPPEPIDGNVEYKLKVSEPTKEKLQHLVSQMKWRLQEGGGEAVYKIGVLDDGNVIGIEEEEMNITISVLKDMANELVATTRLLQKQLLSNGRCVAEMLIQKLCCDQNSPEVRIAVLGSTEAGKSTLISVLTEGECDNGHGNARLVVFRHLHEFKSGQTSSVSHNMLNFNKLGEPLYFKSSKLLSAKHIHEESQKCIHFLDLPGHHKYLKTTIKGICTYLPHYALFLIANTSTLIMKDHLEILLMMEIPFVIVITKTDLAEPTETLLVVKEILKNNKKESSVINSNDVSNALQNKENVVPIFCVSNTTGNGLNCLLKYLYNLPSKIKECQSLDVPEFKICEIYNVTGVGKLLGGFLVRGMLTEGREMKLGPFSGGSFIPITLKSIYRNNARSRIIKAGQSASINIGLIDGVRPGMVLLDAESDATACTSFQAEVTVMHKTTAVCAGFQTFMYIENIKQTVIATSVLQCQEFENKFSATFRFTSRPEYVCVGAKVFFKDGLSKGVGTVTQVFPNVDF